MVGTRKARVSMAEQMCLITDEMSCQVLPEEERKNDIVQILQIIWVGI